MAEKEKEKMEDKDEKEELHIITYHYPEYSGIDTPNINAYWRNIHVRCSCGASWTIAVGRTDEYKCSIEESHRRYAKRMITKVD